MPCDFTYAYYQQLLNTAEGALDIYPIERAPQLLDDEGSPKLLLRHDIDVSPDRALRMARIEHDLGVQSTYMVIPDSHLYRLEDEGVRNALRRIAALRHEIGLHFDLDEESRRTASWTDAIEKQIYSAREYLERAIATSVSSISFHRPIPALLRGPLYICGMTNAYAERLMTRYISDSKGYWREGEPLPILAEPDASLLQMLVHPIWWGEKHMAPEKRLQEFFKMATNGKTTREIRSFDEALVNTTAVRRSGRVTQ